jgi:hypothetical protein
MKWVSVPVYRLKRIIYILSLVQNSPSAKEEVEYLERLIEERDEK